MADLQTPVQHTEEASEWQERPYVPQAPQALPSSQDKEFWGDSRTQVADADKLTERSIEQMKQLGEHTLRIEGPDFVCTSCPNQHTVPLSTKKYTLDHTGKLIAIDKGR